MRWRRPPSRRRDDDLAAEMQAHVDLLADQLVAQGRSLDEARREARLKFGNPVAKREQVRDQRLGRIIEAFRRDLRTVMRGLRAAPGFTLVIVTVLTLAFTALTGLFAVVDSVMLRPLPFPETDRLVKFGRVFDGRVSPSSYSPTEFLGLRERRDVFEAVAAVTGADVYLRREAGRPAERLAGQQVSAEFFDVLRVQPTIGRPFGLDNEVEGRHLVAVISHRLWQQRFDSRPDVVGATLTTGDGPVEILGVMPPGFAYPVASSAPSDLYMPFVVSADERLGHVRSMSLQLVGRLRDGVSLDAARAAGLTRTAQAAIVPQTWRPGPVALVPLQDAESFWVREWMWMLLVAVACVVALATVNVANLLAVRATVRSREWALRAALGATRWDVARLLTLESLVLALAGVTVGIVGGWAGIEVLRPLLPVTLPRIASVSVDARTVAVALGVAVLLGVVGGVAPFWQARRDLRGTLAQAGRALTASREHLSLRATLLTAEIALAVILVLAGALFLLSFARVSRVDLGIDVENVLVAPIRPGAQGLHRGTAADGLVLLDELATRLRALPGVEAVALVSGNMPLSGSYSSQSIAIPGRELADEDPSLAARITRVSPEYFDTLRIATVRGRTIEPSDTEGAPPVVVLSQAAARRYFPQRDALGEIIEIGQPFRVVGIVEDVRDAGPEHDAGVSGQVIYVPLAQSPSPGAELLIRVSPRQRGLAATVMTAIRDVYPDMAVVPVLPLSDYLHAYLAERQFNMVVIGTFAVLGLAIAGIGIHGVTAHVVVQRTREIGIRRALGGGTSSVVWGVLRGTTAQIATGMSLGVAAALYLSTLAGEFLFQTDPLDPWLFAGAAAMLVVSAIAAAFAPAYRAARVDPATVLRFE